jgi:hypothetical protein
MSRPWWRIGGDGTTCPIAEEAPCCEWFPDVGAQAFRAALQEAGVPGEVIHFELFEAGHMGIDYHYPLSLAWLCQRIAP